MKSLARNKQFYYYATYQGLTEATDSDGNYTGEMIPTYSDVVEARDNISAARGRADEEVFGLDLNYQKTIATTDTEIDEYTIVWILGTQISDIEDSDHSQGDFGLYNGRIYKCTETYEGEYDSDYWEEAKNNYKVVRVAKSLNSTLYALQEVDKDAENSD